MVSYYTIRGSSWVGYCVLILIVVDDGLVQPNFLQVYFKDFVLILIVVDDGLVPFTYAVNYSETWVS